MSRLRALLLASAGLALSIVSCADGGNDLPPDATTQCADGLDNDGDTLVDLADPDCTGRDDNDEYAPSAGTCADGLDNDNDGKTDFPNDPGCLTANQDSGEEDDCPTGPNCPACGNGVDDDDDGKTDYAGGDSGCLSAADRDEYAFDAQACGGTTSVSVLPSSGTVSGTLAAGTSNVNTTCGGTTTLGAGAEVAYVITVDRPMTLVATTAFPGTTFDTVLYVRRACTVPASELACSDDLVGGGNGSTVTVAVAPGAYYLIVDAKTAGLTGEYVLQARLYAAQGETCAGPDQCPPGFVCRTAVGGTGTTCERPVCSDGRDDDADTKIDYPLDPGCTTPDDMSEDDTCPGAGCPACGNGLDDDGDGQTDYPADVSCTSAATASEADCPTETDPLATITAGTTTGTTTGAGNQFVPSCSSGSTAPDRVHMLYVRAPLATLVLDTNGSTLDTVMSLKNSLCTTDVQCDDDGGSGGSRIARTNVAAGSYAVVVDGYLSGAGAYTLHVSGTYANGAACDPTMPMFVCGTGYACTGAAGAETCAPAACNDTTDADGDGAPGYPSDPGCTSINDGDEADDCPTGPNCPQCSNDQDDDGDGQTDYPADVGCSSAAGANEQCVTTDPVRVLTTATLTNQSTAGLANDLDLSCGTDGRDEVFKVRVDFPVDELRVDTIGSALDAVVALKSPSCSTFDLQCDDNGGGGTAAQLFLVDPAPGEYFIVVDDKNAASPATYNLRVRGRYLDGGRCNPTSVFTCNTGYACTGAAGAETCAPAACNDTTDADGDGFPGYPSDPGCTSTSDGDELDNCPSGVGCPVCADGLDNDGDGFTDYPNDPACAAASVDSELAPCTSSEPVQVLTTAVTGASTMGHFNDVQLSCGQNGRDDIYRLNITQPLVTLQVDTLGSDIATALGVRTGTCNGTDLACAINNFGNMDSRVTLTNVAVGEYFVIVDDQLGTPTTYNLNVSGTLPAGSRCTPASTTFVCTTGYACAGAAGAETCAPSVCNDQIDADGDGRVGYPSDPGCVDISDNDETDACPSGPGCPVCSNGLDDDGDTRIDYPTDLGCTAASSSSELECAGELDPLTVVGMQVNTGTTAGASNDFLPSCRASFSMAPDRVYLLTLPVPVTNLRLATAGSAYDTTIMLKPATCGTAELACDDDGGAGLDSLINQANLAAGTYAVVVDGASSGSSGAFTLDIRGTVAAGQACTNPLFAAGVLACSGSCTAGVCQ